MAETPVRGPFVHRPPATATWEYDHRWGSMIGDTTALRVTRRGNGALTLSYGDKSIEVPVEAVGQLAAMTSAAAVWTDTGSKAPEGEG